MSVSGVSVDVPRLEELLKFMDFLKALSNLEEFKSHIAELTTLKKDLEKVNGVYQELEFVNKYKAEQEKLLFARDLSVKNQEKAYESKVAQKEKELAERLSKVEQDEKEVEENRTSVKALENQLKRKLADVEKLKTEQTALNIELQDKKSYFEVRTAQLKKAIEG